MNCLDKLPTDILDIINNMIRDDYLYNEKISKIAFWYKLFYKRMLRNIYLNRSRNHPEFDYLKSRIQNIYEMNMNNIYRYKYNIIQLILEDFIIIE